jgi:hypothetical protein
MRFDGRAFTRSSIVGGFYERAIGSMLIEIILDGKKKQVRGHRLAIPTSTMDAMIPMLDEPDDIPQNWHEVTSLADTCRAYITLWK